MRFYLAEDLNPELFPHLRGKGLDVIRSRESGKNGLSRAEQLRRAARQGRALITRNRLHFSLLTVSAFETLAPHAGVLIVPHAPKDSQFDPLVQALEAYAQAHPEGMQPYAVEVLSSAKQPGHSRAC